MTGEGGSLLQALAPLIIDRLLSLHKRCVSQPLTHAKIITSYAGLRMYVIILCT